MKRTVGTSCDKAVSLFRGLYGRVARDLRVDPSYISRIARGERKSKVAERALNREFQKVLILLGNGSPELDKNKAKRAKSRGSRWR